MKLQIVILALSAYMGGNLPLNTMIDRPIPSTPAVSANTSGVRIKIDSVEIIVRLGNITNDTASTNEIIANRGLKLILKGYPPGFKAKVTSFSIITVQNMDTVALNVPAEGNFLSQEQIHQIRKLNGSGKVIFHLIRAVGTSGRARELNPFTLVVKG